MCGKETIKEWRTKVDFEDDRLEFKGKDKNIELAESERASFDSKVRTCGNLERRLCSLFSGKRS